MKSKRTHTEPLEGYADFLHQIQERIQRAHYQAVKAFNKEMILLYWDLGQLIVVQQEKLGWGKSVVERLSNDLQTTFPGANGFSAQNLWNMRLVHLELRDKPNLQSMTGEIAWTHSVSILTKCKNDLEREFYILHTRKFGWTDRLLKHHIENKSYEKYLLNQTNFDQTVPENYKKQAILAVKDHYTFDFLNLQGEHTEKELEESLVRNIRAFLLEMGHDFAFMGNQYRILVEGEEFFIDLLLYHRRLRCLVAIDLKIGDFKPEYKGKMEFYLTALNAQIKLPDEQDAIGIIICKDKKKTIVEYSLRNATLPIGVATYSLRNTLPESYQGFLPTPELIVERLAHLKKLLE